ncbi:hypothetical protein AB0M47_11415 [Hamadaea sp. NPDC051192]|uniref:hypothetical protein n=1 Tax=Hamadaea sp. NPDC051192 TaxID=3154940 RepID=UPI00342AFA4F
MATLCAWLSGLTTTAFLTGFVLVMSDPNAMGASLAVAAVGFFAVALRYHLL